MATANYRPRSRSHSIGAGRSRPQPVKRSLDVASSNDSPRANMPRAAMPRAASTSNMYRLAEPDDDIHDDPESALANIAREQLDRETLRDLIKFFRTTEPPNMRGPSMETQHDCFRPPVLGDRKRWSIQSLRKGRRSKDRPSSLQLQFANSIVPNTTSAGNSYIAISVPPVDEYVQDRRISWQTKVSNSSRSQSPSYARSIEPGWPARISSRQNRGPTSPVSFDLHSHPLKEEPAENGNADGDDMSRTSSLRLYGNMLRLLNSSPIEEETKPNPKSVDVAAELANGGPVRSSAIARASPTSPTSPTYGQLSPTSPTAPTNGARSSTSSTGTRPSTSPSGGRPSTAPKSQGQRPSSPRQSTQSEVRPTLSLTGSSSHRVPSPTVSQRQRAVSPGSINQNHKRQLSAFPSSSQSRPNSPRSSSKPKSTSNLRVNSTLEVPKTAPLPQSPGFPNMLAAMTFPAPPDSSPSHSAKNSISSITTHRSQISTAPTSAVSTRLMSESMDQRIMKPVRPALRMAKSDGGLQVMHTAKPSLALSERSTHSGKDGEVDELSTQAKPLAPTEGTEEDLSRPDSPSSFHTAKPEAKDYAPISESSRDDERRSRAGTTDTIRSETFASHHDSMISDATTASDATATTQNVDQSTPSGRESRESMTILEKKRSRWSLAHQQINSSSRGESTEDESRGQSSIRSESVSSAGTSTGAQSLAERRKARRAKVREKVHKDLNALTINNLKAPTRLGTQDAVDSPVLGWFSQNAPPAQVDHGAPATLRALRRTSMQGPSPLARSSTPDESEESVDPATSDISSKRSSMRGDSQIAQEVTSSRLRAMSTEDSDDLKTPTAATVAVEREPEPKTPVNVPELTLSPVMVTVNIEGRSPTSPLRPLSLLNQGSPSHAGVITSLRSENRPKGRQRPVPIKITKPDSEKMDKTQTKAGRKSVPTMPTPPMSPEFAAASSRATTALSSRRMSLPSQGSPATQTQTFKKHPWKRPSLDARLPHLSKEEETQWLHAHQRETAQEWRVAALKERMRVERLAIVKGFLDPDKRSSDVSLPDVETVTEDGENKQKLREKHSSSSLNSAATTKANRQDALNMLNTNAAGNDSSRMTMNSSASGSSGEDAKTVSTDVRGSEEFETIESIEQRLRRLEKNSGDLMGEVMPLLQSMNRMLREMQRESVGRELTLKLMDSALSTY